MILRPIRWRFVIFDNAGCSGICPIWCCDHVSMPSSLCCELRNKSFASPLVRDVLREMVLSLSRSSESVKHQTDLCLICVASMFRKYSIQCLWSRMLNNCGPYFGSDLAHLEVLRKEVEVRREEGTSVAGVRLGSPTDSRAKTSLKVLVLNYLVTTGILPSVKSTSQKRDAVDRYTSHVIFLMQFTPHN